MRRLFYSWAVCRCSACGRESRIDRSIDLDTSEVFYPVAWRGVCWKCGCVFVEKLIFDCGVSVTS